MKVRTKSAHYLPLKELKYKILLAHYPDMLKLKKKKLEVKYKFATYSSRLCEQIGCVDRFQIKNPEDEEWFIRTTEEEFRHYNNKMHVMNAVMGVDKDENGPAVNEQEKSEAASEEDAEDQ